MPGEKWPDQTLDQAFGLPEVLVAIGTSRLSCKRAGKTRTLMRFRIHLENLGLYESHGVREASWIISSKPGAGQEACIRHELSDFAPIIFRCFKA